MQSRLILLFFYFIAWTLFFLVARGLFMLYQFDASTQLAITDILLTFVHGIRMDFSMAGYFSLIPGLILTFTFFSGGKSIWRLLLVYTVFVLLLASFVVVLDFELYKHWGFRLDATPILYFGKEAASTGDFWTSLILVTYWLLIFSVALFAFRRYFKNRVVALRPTTWLALPVVLLVTTAIIIPIRGSFGVAPMNSGFVYFHDQNIFANHAAVNVVWNFGYAVQKMNKLKYADNYFDREKTEKYFKELYPKTDSTYAVLNTKQPNIMIIVLESYTYRFIESLGGLPGITPNFNKLVNEGILFDNFYSSGDRTDKGIVSILNGYPAQPVTSIIKDPKKTESLPYLNKNFEAIGYRSEFTYGYNINYANFNSYLIHADFDHITHSKDFPQELNTSKWGVHDEFVFHKFLEETEKCPQPFFKIMMTQSSHEPFDVPMETVIKGDDDVHKFLNSAFYTDSCLGKFINKAKQTAWWNNTLVVITADHGHIMPDNQGLTNPRRFKIPMLWLGGALAVRDTVIHTMAGHTDIANTILSQVNLYDRSFEFSNNILSSAYNPFAVYMFNNGFGYLAPGKVAVYDNIANKYILQEGQLTANDLEVGKAYLQKLYWDFNSR